MLSLGSLILASITLALAITCWRLPGRSVPRALKIASEQSVRVLPVVLPAVMAAGFIGALLPEAWIARALGPESGLLGAFLAAGLGILLPTGPMVVLPIAAALMAAGAGAGQAMALFTAWSLVNAQRLFLWELTLIGRPLTTRRYLSGLIVLPLALVMGLLSAAIFDF